MNIISVIYAAGIVGIVGILIGLLLGVASEKFKVEVDEREEAVREALPGNNCGGCGYAGCDGLAKAIAMGEAKVNGCPVGGNEVAEAIGAIMGIKTERSRRMVSYVRCKGSCDKTRWYYKYVGVQDCSMAMTVPGHGGKACEYGCIGFGSCIKACKFNAIHMVGGISWVDRDACTNCGMCREACPKGLIDMVPYDTYHLVQCFSQDKGKAVKEKCDAGCIACTMCVRACTDDAIHMQGNVACVDYIKCTNCGKCAAKCPTKVIQIVDGQIAMSA